MSEHICCIEGCERYSALASTRCPSCSAEDKPIDTPRNLLSIERMELRLLRHLEDSVRLYALEGEASLPLLGRVLDSLAHLDAFRDAESLRPHAISIRTRPSEIPTAPPPKEKLPT